MTDKTWKKVVAYFENLSDVLEKHSSTHTLVCGEEEIDTISIDTYEPSDEDYSFSNVSLMSFGPFDDEYEIDCINVCEKYSAFTKMVKKLKLYKRTEIKMPVLPK